MEPFVQIALHPFTLGLLLGLLVAAFVLKSGFTAARTAKRERLRLESDIKDLQSHLNIQLKINASGNQTIQAELESLRIQNENLRVNQAALQQKPGRAEMRMLQVYEMAIRRLQEQAPGFATAWEQARRQAENDTDAAESGLRKLVRRILPATSPVNPSVPAITDPGDENGGSRV
ncbi:MAG: hypothetical protein V4733_06720 [Verrucomicrobiota bacterium]